MEETTLYEKATARVLNNFNQSSIKSDFAFSPIILEN